MSSKLPSEPPLTRPPRVIEGRRFVWILSSLALVVILIAVGTYLMVLQLREKYGLPIN